MDTADQLTPAVQDYLKAIHSLGGAEAVVWPVDIADRLQVRSPSVTGMLKRLAEGGLIRYECVQAGDQVIIREVEDEHPERLRRWQALGLTPGTTVRVRSHQPLDDLYELEVGGQVIAVGSEGLRGLRGERLPPA